MAGATPRDTTLLMDQIDSIVLTPNTSSERARAGRFVQRRVADPGPVLAALGLDTDGEA
jgi:hypothetical protein